MAEAPAHVQLQRIFRTSRCHASPSMTISATADASDTATAHNRSPRQFRPALKLLPWLISTKLMVKGKLLYFSFFLLPPLKRRHQAVSGISQISFSAEESVSPKKPTSLPEVAKQRELSGTLESEADANVKKQQFDAKNKELSGHDIFGPPPENPPRPLAARNFELIGQLDFGEPTPCNMHSSVMVSNPAGGQSSILLSKEEGVTKTVQKIHTQKFQDLTGSDIFKGDAVVASAEKPLSSAKLKEIAGSDIFADGKAASREYFGGVRKPPGGRSSIALV
ncbi:hypothetical protein KSP40_PGU002458 [Platanthera guangdongensis]|uniref:DUF4057 domain-containing protein n=1 Tax=Platanthera guangdongensis TaxID=2320717 RepID=A0ABR2LQR5_9ASPA